MEKNLAYFKKLLADHSLDILYDELFALMNSYLARRKDKLVAEKHDELVLLSGKRNSLEQSLQLGTMSNEEWNLEIGRLNYALLDLLNELPEAFFQQVQDVDTGVVAGTKKQYGIPSGIGKGLFWMGSVVMLMITLGSMVQHNWTTTVFTGIATLLCLPPSFDFITDRLRVSLSNSVRVLAIIVLTSIGLSFATPVQKATSDKPAEQSQPHTR